MVLRYRARERSWATVLKAPAALGYSASTSVQCWVGIDMCTDMLFCNQVEQHSKPQSYFFKKNPARNRSRPRTRACCPSSICLFSFSYLFMSFYAAKEGTVVPHSSSARAHAYRYAHRHARTCVNVGTEALQCCWPVSVGG